MGNSPVGFRCTQLLSTRSRAVWCCACLLLIQTACQRQATKEEMLAGLSEENRRALESMVNTPFITAGIDLPEFTSVEDANLKDADSVIGILVDGQPRAYPLSRLSSMVDHVVNDRVVGTDGKVKLLTVTYCDMTDCVRVLEPTEDQTAQATSQATGNSVSGASADLDISTLGLLDGGLALQWNGKSFKQTEQVEGLKDYAYQRATWQEWKARYPQSLVYKGRTKPKK